MSAILFLGVTILLLVLALEPARRRFQQGPPVPTDASRDRDTQRLLHELSSRLPDSTAQVSSSVQPALATGRSRVATPSLRHHSAA